jgi:TRAP-type C4-dicarboxylate transport system permease small subunit
MSDKEQLPILPVHDETITKEIDNSKIEFSNKTEASNRGPKKVILIITTILIAFFAFLLILTSGNKPGEYVGLGMLLLPIMPIIWIFYSVYFIILALRYSREKSNMDPLDKIMFYILLAGIGIFFLLALSKA